MRFIIDYLLRTLNRSSGFLPEIPPRDNRRSIARISRGRSRFISVVAYQQYEPRKLLAGVVFSSSTGEVLIGGTHGNDVGQVTQANDVITVTQEGFDTRTFDVSEVNSIVFVGLRGDDFFQNQTAIPSRAFGNAGNDTLIGGSGADRLVGHTDNDIIRGNGGNDVLIAGNGNDNIDAGAGNDTVVGVRGSNVIESGTGDDRVFGGEDSDQITDVSGNDLLAGFDGNDSIRGGDGNDLIFGGQGEDILRGEDGDDQIYAGTGDDFLSGGSGADNLNGNDGDDVLQGERGFDRIVGGTGFDRANYSGEIGSYDVTGRSTAAFFINDLRGPSFGLEDRVLSLEQFAFVDGVLTAEETLNPVVNPPGANVREIVFVQPIVAANSDGSNQAEFFGSESQEVDILNRIDAIFAQADIDIEFLPTRRVNDSFINVGNGTGERTRSDLNRIISDGDSRGVGHQNRNVIDLYFVERAPGFEDLGDSFVNGLAFVGSAGSAIHVGDRLVDTSSGRQTIAEVTAHEIGHNLGLSHVNTSNNLLAANGGGTDLTDSQINTILRSSLSQPTANATTSATLVELDLSGATASPDEDRTLSLGGCGGCGVCRACTS